MNVEGGRRRKTTKQVYAETLHIIMYIIEICDNVGVDASG